MVNKHLIALLAVLFLLPLSVSAQNLGELIFGKKSKADYIGQWEDRHKVKTGLGIQRYKNGSVYVGDFHKGKPGGKGMLIIGKGSVSNAAGAAVYVGSWLDGKKEGKGMCYAPNGDIIYQGKFSNDKPTSTFPTPDVDMQSYFTMQTVGKELYWGEVTKRTPNGFGLFVQEDGGIWFGNLVNGRRTGVSMTVYGSDYWEIGEWENGHYSAFNNSEIDASRKNEYKAMQSAIRSELASGMWEVAQGLANTSIQLAEQVYASKGGSVGVADGSTDAGGSSSGKSKKSSSSAKKSDSDYGTAWLTESRAYDDYDSQLVYHGESMSESRIKSIQKKMRDIRKKWEARGCLIPKSSREDRYP